MYLIRSILLIFLLSIAVGCNRNNQLRQVRKMHHAQISLHLISEADSLHNHPKVIVYHDSNQCSTCQLEHISEWDKIIKHLDSLQLPIPVIFIITPPEGRIKEVTQYLNNLKLQRYHIVIDSLNLFSKHNPIIPDNIKLHTFLLDKNNHIILVGSPLFNEKLWNMYKNITQKLNYNNGILPI